MLVLLRDRLDAYLHAAAAAVGDDSPEDRAQLIDGDKADTVDFRLNAISILLINLEPETSVRAPDPWLRVGPDGRQQRVMPDLRLNLHVLFVARFKGYALGLNQLALVMRFFQGQPVFDRENTPALPAAIDKLVIELVNQPQHEQNNIWSALRVHYQPSVLYRVRMVVLSDPAALTPPRIEQTVVHAHRRDA
ncbi:DUF4255 domain-containing protein [Aquabacterium sp. OR-4]|uniref:DUF4255 domain-containing protein n=1 Tax=Aquabacterium sp. OR-4 TaxID=2978127 RepID=UPI0028CA669B|nr:DUF4255 domain-containing protein [Aquabacterium sp. OR-4]MDT7836297.1 DUF4255 domain-containing protein [Aquabacterium sp. OR-4]